MGRGGEAKILPSWITISWVGRDGAARPIVAQLTVAVLVAGLVFLPFDWLVQVGLHSLYTPIGWMLRIDPV